MVLSSDELSDIRNDVGDTGTTFSDAELQRLYVRVGENYDKTVLLAIDQLLGNAAKFADYTQNETQEKKSQVFANLLKMRDIWAKKVDKAANQGANALRISGIRPTARTKDTPGDW